MAIRKIEGEYIHKGTNTVLKYVCTYKFSPIGVVYETYASEPGQKSVRLALGVRTWGSWVLFLPRRLREEVHFDIDTTDMEKFRAAANEV
jgi:hypothetical protein